MKLILCGGGSGDQNKFANSKLDEIINYDKPLLYIPLAMSENEHPNYDDCYEWIKNELKSVRVPYIDMVRNFEQLNEFDFNDYSAIFIGGENTYKLLKGLKDNGIFQKILNFIKNEGIIIGGSAGAVIFGKDINIIASMDQNDVMLEDTKGFDCIEGISIFPHYINYSSKLNQEENEKRIQTFTNAIKDFSLKNGKVIALPEEDAIFINDSRYEILGSEPFYICEKGKMIKHELNSEQIKK